MGSAYCRNSQEPSKAGEQVANAKSYMSGGEVLGDGSLAGVSRSFGGFMCVYLDSEMKLKTSWVSEAEQL